MAGEGQLNIGVPQDFQAPMARVMAQENLKGRGRTHGIRTGKTDSCGIRREKHRRHSVKGPLQVSPAAERRLAAVLHPYHIDAVLPALRLTIVRNSRPGNHRRRVHQHPPPHRPLPADHLGEGAGRPVSRGIVVVLAIIVIAHHGEHPVPGPQGGQGRGHPRIQLLRGGID